MERRKLKYCLSDILLVYGKFCRNSKTSSILSIVSLERSLSIYINIIKNIIMNSINIYNK